MAKMIFVNLPVTDIPRSVEFYMALGFVQNMKFSDEHGVALVWDGSISLMVLTHDFYRTFLRDQEVADTQAVSGSITTLTMESIDEVKQFAATAGAHGGTSYHIEMGIPEDQMYGLEVKDPDGNMLEVVWMAAEE